MVIQWAVLSTNCCRAEFIILLSPPVDLDSSSRVTCIFLQCISVELCTRKQSYVTWQGATQGAKTLQSILEAALKLAQWIIQSCNHKDAATAPSRYVSAVMFLGEGQGYAGHRGFRARSPMPGLHRLFGCRASRLNQLDIVGRLPFEGQSHIMIKVMEATSAERCRKWIKGLQ